MGFKAWLRNWLFKEEDNQYSDEIRVSDADDEMPFDNHRNTIRFTVSTARGGCIVSIRQYDSHKDETINTVHVIHDDEDIATNIAHIVSMEMLRKT